jgi:hypothetical protein
VARQRAEEATERAADDQRKQTERATAERRQRVDKAAADERNQASTVGTDGWYSPRHQSQLKPRFLSHDLLMDSARHVITRN